MKPFIALTFLLLVIPAYSYEVITVGNFEAQLLAPEETAYVVGALTIGTDYVEGFRKTITGDEPWTQEHRDAITRSLQSIDQSFDTGSPSRRMQIALALNEGAYFGDSIPTQISDQTRENGVSTGELLLRDNVPINNILGSVDNVIRMYTSVALHYGPEAPAHGQYDFQTTITHEILHAMGIKSGIEEDGSSPYGISRWDSLLQDSEGGYPTPGSIPSIATTGELGTVFWIGAAANATYGGPVPIRTYVDKFSIGSSLVHTGPLSELMTDKGDRLDFPRALNKLLLDMYRDMGWKINEAYYNSFGPTYYDDETTISNADSFEANYSYSYGMYVNGDNNLIKQEGDLKMLKEQSNALYVCGDGNEIRLSGTQAADANYSHALYAFGTDNQIFTESEGVLSAQGDGSVGILIFGINNAIYHSGTILANNGASAIRIDNHRADRGQSLNTSLHIQSGSEIIGDIVNSDLSSVAEMTFGRKYMSDDTYTADPGFSFFYNDEIRGNWSHTVTAGKLSLGPAAIIEGNMANNGTLAGSGSIIGDVSNNGMLAPGHSIGKLIIDGKLSLNSSSDLQIEFGDGAYDQLVVSDTANLDGSLSLIPIGYLAPGAHQFINAGGITGNFATVNNFSSSILQTSTSSLDPGSFTLARNSYASVSESEQQSLASAFDRARPTVSGDMADILNLLDLMALGDLRRATEDYSPYLHNSITTASLESIRTRSTIVQNKIQQGELAGKSPFWLSSYKGSNRYDKTMTSHNFKTEYTGFILGCDKEFKSGFQLGVAAAYTDFNFKEKTTRSHATSAVYDGYLYGSWSPQSNDAFYLQSILGFGVTDFETNREIPFLDRTASSDHAAKHYSAFLGGGYEHKMGNWSIMPRAGFEYISLDEDGFTENRAGSASLAVGSKASDALVSSLGIEVSHLFDFNSGLILPSFRVEWLHNISAEAKSTVSTLESGETFSISGREESEDSLELSVGIAVIFGEKLHGSLDYQYTFADNQDGAHLLSIELGYYF